VNRRFARVTAPVALSCISLIVRPSKLSVFDFLFSRNPAIADWCTTLHLLLQNVYFSLSPEGHRSTERQDLLQSKIITALPRLRTLHFYTRLHDRRVPFHLQFDHTVAALGSLAHVRRLSLHTHQGCTLYNMRILRKLAPSLVSLEIRGEYLDRLLIHDVNRSNGVLPFEDSNGVVHNRLKFPNLQFLDLSNADYREAALCVHNEICFERSFHTLRIGFYAVLFDPPQPFPHTFDRLILCESRNESIGWKPYTLCEEIQFPEGLAAGTIEFVILVDVPRDAGSPLLREMLQSHLQFVRTILAGKVKKVVWRMEFASTALRHLAQETLQEAAILSLFRSIEDVCLQNGLVWEIEQP
jgi:hypothetical protein